MICYILGMIFLIWDLYNFYNEYLFVIVFFFGVGWVVMDMLVLCNIVCFVYLLINLLNVIYIKLIFFLVIFGIVVCVIDFKIEEWVVDNIF